MASKIAFQIRLATVADSQGSELMMIYLRGWTAFLLMIPVIGSVGCARHRSFTMQIVDEETQSPVEDAFVSYLAGHWQPHIPLCFPVRIWFPVSDPLPLDEKGLCTINDFPIGNWKLEIEHPLYERIIVEKVWPRFILRYMESGERVEAEMFEKVVIIPLRRLED